MRQISVITVHPQFIESYCQFGPLSAAKASYAIDAVNLRDFAVDRHSTVDGRPFGGGDGMVLRPEPLRDALATCPGARVILLAPSGTPWTQTRAQELASSTTPLAFICGRFGGVDQRFVDKYVDEVISIGDYVISGGELAALVAIDSIVRLTPGAMSNPLSPVHDSFAPGCDYQLEHPLYTRPRIFEGQQVPEVLLSGDHDRIAAWQLAAAREQTAKWRPDLQTKP